MKKMLFITDTSPFPTNAGNRKRIRDLLNEFSTNEIQIDIIYYHRHGSDEKDIKLFAEIYDNIIIVREKKLSRRRLSRKIRSIVFKVFKKTINYRIDDWCGNDLIMEVERRKSIGYDLVWIEYIMLSRVFDYFDNTVTKIIDTHDSFTNRSKLFINKNVEPEFYYCNLNNERKGLERADIVVSVSDKESAFFKSIISSKTKVVTIGNFMPIYRQQLTSQSSILFVGSNNRMNITGINRFIHQILPEVKREVVNVKLYICGSVCDSLPDSNDYIKLGFVENIDDVYAKARVVICPTVGGTGQHVKCLEALYHSKAIVTTHESAKGINYSEEPPFVEAEFGTAFTDAVVRLLNDDLFCQEFETRAYDFAVKNNKKAKNGLRSILE